MRKTGLGPRGDFSFPVFSENMQRKASHATKVTHTSIFPDFPFQRWPPMLSIQRELAAESLGMERDRWQEKFTFPQRLLVFFPFFFFPLLLGFKMHITEGKVQGLEKDMRLEREALRF